MLSNLLVVVLVAFASLSLSEALVVAVVVAVVISEPVKQGEFNSAELALMWVKYYIEMEMRHLPLAGNFEVARRFEHLRVDVKIPPMRGVLGPV
jgi:hypothetical protein